MLLANIIEDFCSTPHSSIHTKRHVCWKSCSLSQFPIMFMCGSRGGRVGPDPSPPHPWRNFLRKITKKKCRGPSPPHRQTWISLAPPHPSLAPPPPTRKKNSGDVYDVNKIEDILLLLCYCSFRTCMIFLLIQFIQRVVWFVCISFVHSRLDEGGIKSNRIEGIKQRLD